MSNIRVNELESLTTGRTVLVDDIDTGGLREDLANPDKGALMVRGAVIYVNTIADLQALNTSELVDGATAELSGYDTAGDGGGGPRRIYKAGVAPNTYVHDGVSVIVPEGSDGSSAWVWEYTGTIDARWFGVDTSGETNTGDRLTAYLEYMLSTKNVGSCSGTFRLTAPFTIKMNRGTYLWDVEIITDNESEIGVIINADRVEMFGTIRVTCADNINDSSEADYYARRQDIGVYMTGVRRSRLARFETYGTKRTGVLIDHLGGNSNMFHIDTCYTYNSGSSRIFSSQVDSSENTGAGNSYNQRYFVTPVDPIPETLSHADYCAINGQLHIVVGVDFSTNRIELFPQAEDTTPGEIKYFIGEGVRVQGTDANVSHIRLIDATRVGTAAKLGTIYGGIVDVLHAANHGVGAAVGRLGGAGGSAGHVCMGGIINWLYTETGHTGPYSLVEIGVNSLNWKVNTWGDSRNLSKVHLVPRGEQTQLPKIQAQRLSESDSPTFRGMTLRGGPKSNGTVFSSSGSARGYLLIGRPAEPVNVWGEIHTSQGNYSSSEGRHAGVIRFFMVTQSGGRYSLHFESSQTGWFGAKGKLVEYEGEEWVALDLNSAPWTFRRNLIGSEEFKTVPVGSATVIDDIIGSTQYNYEDKFFISPDGSLLTRDNESTLGLSSQRWSEVYAVNGTINTSDEREKQQISNLSNVEVEVAKQLKGMIRKFKWNHAVATKGDGARWHFGVMAQEVKQAFDDHGLDAHDYGLFCYDEWYEGPEIIDEETGEAIEQEPNRDRYGVRYEQLLAFIISAI